MKTMPLFVTLMLLISAVRADDAKLSVPELEKGDILLSEEYPYRTVKNTSRTVYQLARLGFTNVTSFQDAHGMKSDGVIGPMTQQKVESKFNIRFNANPREYTALSMLGMSVSSKVTNSNIAVTVTMRNESNDSLRIVGMMTYNPDASFLFVDPILPLRSTVTTRNGDLFGRGSGPSAEVMICSKGTAIKPSEQVSATAALLSLRTNQSGRMHIGTTYIDSTLSTGTIGASDTMPKNEEIEDGITR